VESGPEAKEKTVKTGSRGVKSCREANGSSGKTGACEASERLGAKTGMAYRDGQGQKLPGGPYRSDIWNQVSGSPPDEAL
jgi:hypothetical protein